MDTKEVMEMVYAKLHPESCEQDPEDDNEEWTDTSVDIDRLIQEYDPESLAENLYLSASCMDEGARTFFRMGARAMLQRFVYDDVFVDQVMAAFDQMCEEEEA